MSNEKNEVTPLTKDDLVEHNEAHTLAFVTCIDEYIMCRLKSLGLAYSGKTPDERHTDLSVAKKNLSAYVQPLLCFKETE